jgi:hypothetical protein
LALAAAVAAAASAQPRQRFEVSITNLTYNQRFTPILVAAHQEGVKLFDLGRPATSQLRSLAEEGDVGPLKALLMADPRVNDAQNSPPPPPLTNLIAPGATVRVIVEGGGRFDHFSVASMLIPTNDAFLALNGMPGPRGRSGEVTYMVPAYDSGTEINNQLCASIPGPGYPECNGDGGGAQQGMGEGFVHVHRGIHMTGNFMPAGRDWRNPVARITIRRMP